MKIHHIGVICKDLDSAVAHYLFIGFTIKKNTVSDHAKNLNFTFLQNSDYVFELVSKIDRNRPSVIDNLEARAPFGQQMYHLCLITTDMKNEINRLETLGYKTIIPPEISIACDGNLVCYVVSADHGLVEFIEIL